MREALAVAVLALVLAVVPLVPSTSAHAAPNPLANSVHVLADEAEDGFYWYDGYDLYNLYAREAYLETVDEAGLVFRYTLYGGHAPAGQADEMRVTIGATTADGPQAFTIATPDDHNWTGDMEVVVANVTEDDPPWTGVTARMQTFVSYEQLGVGPGGSVENVWMESRADDDLRDRAPGGIFLPGSQGQAEAPANSTRLADSIRLTGPTGYVNTSTTVQNRTLTVTVENALDNGQHVRARLNATPGWNASITGQSQASLPGGETTRFTVEANATPAAIDPLEIEVVTDVGGHETLYVGVNGTQLATGLQAHNVEVEPAQPSPNESPGLTGLATWTGLALLAVVRGRNR